MQTGDPTGTGKGGDSIWGKPIEDELHPELKVCLLKCGFLVLAYFLPCKSFVGRVSFNEFLNLAN